MSNAAPRTPQSSDHAPTPSPETPRRRGRVAALALLVAAGAAGAAGAAAWAADELPWPELRRNYLEASRREHAGRMAGWEPVAAWTFDDGEVPEGFTVFSGDWAVEDGRLTAVAGPPDGNRTIKIADCRWPAFRLEFDVTLRPEAGRAPDRVCDVGIFLNADPVTGRFARGYALITAQYCNQATTLYRLNIPLARTELSPIEPGKRHRVALEVVRPHVRFWVDGRVVLDAWERHGTGPADPSDFLEMDPQRVLALSTYDTRMEINDLTISIPADAAAGGR